MHRRHFVKLALAAAAVAPIRPASLFAQPRASEFVALRRNVGIYLERGGAIGWLANSDGVAIVDSQFPDTAANFLAGLRTRITRPIDVLINSHHHADHSGGNGVLRSAVGRIVAHSAVPDLQRNQAQQRGTEADQAYADTTFESEWTVELGDEVVRAKHYGAAHTAGDASIFFERANIVHMGDLVFNRLHPFVDVPAGANLTGWATVVETIAAEHDADTLFVFGHGAEGFGVTGSRDDLLVQRDYLARVLDTVRRAAAAGESREAILALTTIPGFESYGSPERLANGLAAAYDEVV